MRAYENLGTKSSNWSVPLLGAEICHLFEPRPFSIETSRDSSTHPSFAFTHSGFGRNDKGGGASCGN